MTDQTGPISSETVSRSSFARLRQHCGVRLHRLFLAEAAFIVVLQGSKTVETDRHVVTARAGEVVVLSPGGFADVTNTPDADGVYAAEVIAIGGGSLPASPQPGMPRFGRFAASDGFMTSFDALRSVLTGDSHLPGEIVEYRVRELLLWARLAGICPTLEPARTLPARLRTIVGRDPAKPWRIGELASELAMSEPTLRRQLAAQSTTASEILADVRLTQALGQLQTTTLSVTEIALAAGYESPSRFAHRFRARFGVSPSEIRGRLVRNDRFGTKFDRAGVEAGAAR